MRGFAQEKGIAKVQDRVGKTNEQENKDSQEKQDNVIIRGSPIAKDKCKTGSYVF